MLIAIRPASTASLCPVCGTRSERIHSRYQRRLADLPLVGKPVRLVIDARRFHCDAVLCGRRIFTERFDGDVLAPSSRRTARLDHIVQLISIHGWRKLEQAWSRPSLTASSRTVQPSAPRSRRHGRMARPKGRSPSSNW
ncbi:transposase family protein [Rhizobium leguminosarum bv. viciae]|nr:hypothetical protein [Rhizobium leguminosarum]NKK54146.1 hypothetical protein [Rhizobium leguminosarum bv. viciae]OOO45976.1 hypothetical protein BS629_21675 [Rhizobium leguminosarum bv. viciae USDA 2370]PUB59588.1 hypothetical protein DB728_37865 [Rhizobium leguminosarum bv. viciae USDA 2370]TBY18161.1 transposase family protein [Rhizobium leguminosarum bv. viciae]